MRFSIWARHYVDILIKKFWKKLPRWIKIPVLSVILILTLFRILDIIFPFQPQIEYSQIVEAEDGSILHAFLNDDDKWRLKTELEEITPILRKTIIFKEDKYFKYHFGINPISIVRALVKNIIKGEITSGASTITMQVVRLLEPKERTYSNKIVEMFQALQLEFHYSKDEILQMYLNLVPYGSNIEGVKSASLLYFEQSPEQLSLAQIVTLAMIPNTPTALKLGQNNSYILQKRRLWLEYFRKENLFPDEDINDALDEPLDAYRHEAPKLAPHISYHLKNKFPDETLIQTFIRPQMQTKVENITYNYIKRLRNMNITNAAVLIINNRTNAIETYIGSADFFDNEYEGQVDGVQAIRSPGSTLKPFLYALAIDKGLITPRFVITDVPINYSSYRPNNYDNNYHGLITIEQALGLSLNVPAVKMLDQVEMDYFIQKLIESNFKQIEKDKKKLGLSVILGGCGVSLQELCTMFNSFANDGRLSELKWTKKDISTSPVTLISPEATFIITKILLQLTRPDLPSKYENSMHLPRIAWKTGTSYGRRDAWSIGFNKNYTVGVWVGNFPGYGVPELNGAQYAAPLLFEIFNNIDYNSEKNWLNEPSHIDFRLVCSETGLLPNDFCDKQIMDSYLPGISFHQKCQHRKEVFIDAKARYSYCRSCLPEVGYRKESYMNLPPDILAFYEDQNIPYEKVPPHNPDCSRIYTANAPKITSLTEGMEYLLFKNEGQKLMLRCNAENDVEKIYWYINDKFYKSSESNDKLFFTPSEGEIKVSCTDDKGRNTDIWINVVFI